MRLWRREVVSRFNPQAHRQHLDHSFASRAEYDDLMALCGLWRRRAARLAVENEQLRTELAKEGGMNAPVRHVEVERPALAWGWCRACQCNHEFPSDDCPDVELDEDEAA